MKSFLISDGERKKLSASIAKARGVTAPENSLGQWIGYFIDDGTGALLEEIVEELNKTGQFKLEAAPKPGDGLIRLKNTFGQLKQIDHTLKENGDHIVIVESKWLKDQRHLNDKGSWVLMMPSILRANRKIRGIVTVLAGPWEGMRPVIEQTAKAVMIPIDEVYKILSKHGIKITIDQEKNAYEGPERTLNVLLDRVEIRMKQGYNLLREIGYEILIDYKDELKEKILATLAKKN